MKRTSKVAVVFCMLALLWALGGLWIVPRLITRAYHEESWDVLNSILSGRSLHPLAFYLDAWRSVFVVATLVGGLVIAVGMLAYVFPAGRKRLVARIVAGGQLLSAGDLLWYALWWGTIGGLGEAAYRGIRQAITTRPAANFYLELFWMAPLSSAVGALIIGLLMVVVARSGAARWQVGKATVILAFCATYAVMQSEGIALHPAAEIILSLGIAVAISRAATAHAERLRSALRASRRYYAVLVVVLIAFAWYELPASVERRAIKGRTWAYDSPNVLLIILDTVRAANLSLYGYHRPTTPELEAWAGSGVVFDQAYATAPWTLPSHATVFTGRYNFDLHTGFNRPLDDRFPTLAERFASAGYATGGFVANPIYTTDQSGLQRGFDRWEDYPLGPTLFLESSWISREVTRRLVSPIGWSGNWRKSASKVRGQFLSWRDAQGARPFFAFLNFMDAHDPYDSPSSAALFGPRPPSSWASFLDSWHADPSQSYTPQVAQGWIDTYDNAIHYIDGQLGAIHDALEESGQLDNTIVVVAADHGEMWGEHGQLGHAQSLYRPVLHVPLMISFPGRVPSARRIARYVSLRDVAATVLDLSGTQGPGLPGHSLASLWAPDPDGGKPSPLISELDHDATNANPWDPVSRGDMKGLVARDLHYIRNGDGVEELYDLGGDPEEAHDLAGDPQWADALTGLRTSVDSLLNLPGDSAP